MKIVTIRQADISLQVRTLGPEDGESVILLHGFPECWNTWRHQAEPLAAAGYRVFIPDMRGYGQSSKPHRIERYRLDELVQDVDAIRRYAGCARVHLAGHDWGAAVAWWYALRYEERLQSLSIVNVPHPQAFLNALRRSPLQMLKSWYIFYFQLPWLPEWSMKLFNFAVLRTTLRRTSVPGAYDDEDFNHLQQCWQQPGSLTAMVNYYRALLRHLQLPDGDGCLSIPVQILWGENDIALTADMARASMNFLHNGSLTFYPDATHWLAHDKPGEITERLLSHFRRCRSLSAAAGSDTCCSAAENDTLMNKDGPG
ncbi:MAG: alpha/beta hydrolase [Pseudomonadota bacterium]|nr:alpha/beta hydrolase [Pseudomonadota bacterium]